MISVTEAIEKVTSYLYKGTPIEIPIQEALNFVLAAEVFSLIDMPPFPQSAMDGYAVNGVSQLEYAIIGEVKAGDGQELSLEEGEAVRIFTGAPVPQTATAVIMQEKTSVKSRQLILEEAPVHHQNIRPQAEQIKKGEVAVGKGQKLSPSALSFLVGLGVTKVKVYPKPKVGIVVTGSELIEAGTPLTYGKIYESNATLLEQTLRQEGLEEVNVYRVADNYEATVQLLDKVTNANNFVLVSGGISVGDYDFVGKALKELGTQEVFYKVKQKPGKPLFFGKRGTAFVYALPGNPASALTCFYTYALPMLRYYAGNKNPFLPRSQKRLSKSYEVKGVRAQFLKAIITNDTVAVLTQQSSAMISGFIEANAYVFVPEFSNGVLEEGRLLEVILLP